MITVRDIYSVANSYSARVKLFSETGHLIYYKKPDYIMRCDFLDCGVAWVEKIDENSIILVLENDFLEKRSK